MKKNLFLIAIAALLLSSCRNEISTFREENRNVIEYFNTAINNMDERVDTVTDEDIEFFIHEMKLKTIPYDSVEFYWLGEEDPSMAFIPKEDVAIGFIKKHYGVDENTAKAMIEEYDATNGGDFYTPTFNVANSIYKDLKEVEEAGNLKYMIDYLRNYRGYRFITYNSSSDELFKSVLESTKGQEPTVFEANGMKQFVKGIILVEEQLASNEEFSCEADTYLYRYYERFEISFYSDKIPSTAEEAYMFLVEATEDIAK